VAKACTFSVRLSYPRSDKKTAWISPGRFPENKSDFVLALRELNPS
jgi:RNA-binding protein YlmH